MIKFIDILTELKKSAEKIPYKPDLEDEPHVSQEPEQPEEPEQPKEEPGVLTLYRGVNPQFGDIEHGRMSIGKMHKLVGALGPNYSNKKEVAERYGKQIIVKKMRLPNILELNEYKDVVRMYDTYKFQFNIPNLANYISGTKDESPEQFEFIKKAAKELRDILRLKYDLVKSPLGPGDVNYLKSKGILGGNLYILLKY